MCNELNGMYITNILFRQFVDCSGTFTRTTFVLARKCVPSRPFRYPLDRTRYAQSPYYVDF